MLDLRLLSVGHQGVGLEHLVRVRVRLRVTVRVRVRVRFTVRVRVRLEHLLPGRARHLLQQLLRGAHRLGHVRALVEGDLVRVRVRVRARG